MPVLLLTLQPMAAGKTLVRRWQGRQHVGTLHMDFHEEVDSETLRDFLEVYRLTGAID